MTQSPSTLLDTLLPPAARAEWRAHWKLVIAAAAGSSMAAIGLMSLGVYMPALEQEFGWTRAQVSSGLVAFGIMGVVCGPLLGALIDKWGPRRFGVVGTLLCGLAFAAFGTVSSSLVHWIVLWFVFSLAAQVPRPMIWSAAVSSEFQASRGLALAFVLMGGGVGGIAAPLLSHHLIDAFGWRTAYIVLGLSWGALVCFICYLYFYGRSDRLRSQPSTKAAADVTLPGMTASVGLRSATFAKLAASVILANTLYVGTGIHMVPLLRSKGVTGDDAVWIVGAAGIASLIGKFTCGMLVDRFSARYVSAGFVSCMAAGCALLLVPSASPLFLVLPVVLVALVGGERAHMLPYIVSRYFGLRAFGKIFGVIASLMAAAVGIGPVIAGFIFDHTQRYDLLMIAGIPIALTAVLLILWLGEYPDLKVEVAPGPSPTPQGQTAGA